MGKHVLAVPQKVRLKFKLESVLLFMPLIKICHIGQSLVWVVVSVSYSDASNAS